jgi:PhzF family phenazine biosynthesis protein
VTTQVLRYAAFTVDGRGGNPAGVVLDARGLDGTDMQPVAADLGYSETAFLVARPDEPQRLRRALLLPGAGGAVLRACHHRCSCCRG